MLDVMKMSFELCILVEEEKPLTFCKAGGAIRAFNIHVKVQSSLAKQAPSRFEAQNSTI
jgi:nickel-dependent lactate racemase